MADVKWIKIVTDIFDDEKILFIEQLPDADSIIVIWFKLLTLSGKINNGGVLLFREGIPYTEEMLATIFRRPINTVRLAIKTFEEFGMVEIINNAITIPNWSKHQSLEQMEERREYMRQYMRDYREKQKALAQGETNESDDFNVSDKSERKRLRKFTSKHLRKANVSAPEGEEEVEREGEREGEGEGEERVTAAATARIIRHWNRLNLQQLKAINPGSNRHRLLQARLKEFSLEDVIGAIDSVQRSAFLQGQNQKNWTITFDWFIKPNNFLKVLEGNYLDKKQAGHMESGNYFAELAQRGPGDELE